MGGGDWWLVIPQMGEPGGEKGEARGGGDRPGGEACRPREAVCSSHDQAEALGHFVSKRRLV